MDTKDETKMPQTKRSYVCRTYILRDVGSRGQCLGRGCHWPPDFDRSGGEGLDYAHHILTCPVGFSDLPTALNY